MTTGLARNAKHGGIDMLDRIHIAKVRELLRGRNDASLDVTTATDDETRERKARQEREYRNALVRANMHLVETAVTSTAARRLAATVLCPEFTARAVRVEVWGTTFSAPGDDYCLFCIFDTRGYQYSTVKVSGF